MAINKRLISGAPKPDYDMAILRYTGNATDNRAFTGFGFQPDLVFTVQESGSNTDNTITDSNRGVTKQLYSHEQWGEVTTTGTNQFIRSFDSDGITLGSQSQINGSGDIFRMYAWKINGGTTTTNTTGSINSTVQVNQSLGISIVTYSGNSTGGATIGHGLSEAPEMIIFKNLGSTSDWHVYHDRIPSASNCLAYFNTTGTTGCTADFLNNTAPSSSVITLGSSGGTNGSSMVAYCFHSVAGYSKVREWTGSGSTGKLEGFGFAGKWMLAKQITDGGYNWNAIDMVEEQPVVINSNYSGLQQSTAIATNNNSPEYGIGEVQMLDMSSNTYPGRLRLATTDNQVNMWGKTYIYLAYGGDKVNLIDVA